MKNIEIQEHAFSDLAIALFIRACADARGHVDRSDGDPLVIQRQAKEFLFGATEEWRESKRFWLRIAGIDETLFNEYLLPKLMSESLPVEALQTAINEAMPPSPSA